LAVGRAPFYASKPNQVLLKIRKGEYAWPDSRKHGNDIPNSIRELVAQILVDEDLRPSLDTIVSDDFFKTGFIPDLLNESVLTSTPKWSITPPSSSTIKQGYTKAWHKICKASGIGEYSPGKFFPAVGVFPSVSIYRECELEAESGNMPVIPMPESAVYVPFVYRTGQGSTGGLENVGLGSAQEREISAVSKLMSQFSLGTDHNMPGAVKPQPTKSENNDQKTVAKCHTRASVFSYTDSTRVARRSAALNPEIDAKAGSAAPDLKSNKSTAVLKPRTEQPLVRQSHTFSIRPLRPPRIASQSTSPARIPTSLRARPQLATSQITSRDRTGIAKSVRFARSATTIARRVNTTTGATVRHNAPQITRGGSKYPETTPHDTDAQSGNIAASDGIRMCLHAQTSDILAQAEVLRDNIIAALSSSKSSSASRHATSVTDDLPFVCKWVDYSKKHGIGYTLADGTVGIIANHTESMPITHTVMEHGYKHFDTEHNNFNLETVPFRYFIQAKSGRLEEVKMTGALRKQHTLLWTKFARYMCKQLGSQQTTPSRQKRGRPITIVRFYQRIGSITVWGFRDGCFQVRLWCPSSSPSPLLPLSFLNSIFKVSIPTSNPY
jgi:hypothetical protein